MKKTIIVVAGVLFAASAAAQTCVGQSSTGQSATGQTSTGQSGPSQTGTDQSVGAKAENAAKSAGESTGVNKLVGAAPTTQDFVKKAAISGMFEIKSSQLALATGDEPIKEFARMMIDDHKRIADELKQKVADGSAKVTIPARLDKSHQQMLDKLSKETGQAFLKTYDRDQVNGHKEAVSLFQRYAQGGDNAVLKEWAASTLPTLQSHLDAAQNLPRQIADAQK